MEKILQRIPALDVKKKQLLVGLWRLSSIRKVQKTDKGSVPAAIQRPVRPPSAQFNENLHTPKKNSFSM